MRKPTPSFLESCTLSAPLGDNAVLVIGAGRFGGRAVDLLNQRKAASLLIVDSDEEALHALKGKVTQKIHCDGIHFLCVNAHRLQPSVTIVPALPHHLIFHWLVRLLRGLYSIQILPIPEDIPSRLPHTWAGDDDSLLISYAYFQCPEDCPEPADHCTVTGKPRPVPLYERLRELTCEGYGVHVIRSRQLAPGLGGYRFQEMLELLERVREEETTRWLIGTACRCHGVLNALGIKRGIPDEMILKP